MKNPTFDRMAQITQEMLNKREELVAMIVFAKNTSRPVHDAENRLAQLDVQLRKDVVQLTGQGYTFDTKGFKV